MEVDKMASGKVTEDAKEYIRAQVLSGLTYAQVAEGLLQDHGIEISKQAVSYYVGQFGLRQKLAEVREQRRREQEAGWRELLVAWLDTLDEEQEVTLRAASKAVEAPDDWIRSELIAMGVYDDTTFRERIGDVELMTRYIVDDLSLSEMHEQYYSDVCVSTLTQTMRTLLQDNGLQPRPKSCAGNKELRQQWRRETLEALKRQGWTVSAT